VDYLIFPVVCSGTPFYIGVILDTMVMKNSALHIICPTPNPSPDKPPFPGK